MARSVKPRKTNSYSSGKKPAKKKIKPNATDIQRTPCQYLSKYLGASQNISLSPNKPMIVQKA